CAPAQRPGGRAQGSSPHPRGPSTHGRLDSTPDDLVHAIRQALEVGEAGRARELALEGAQRYPAHAELHTYARLLAPPTTRVVLASPAARASVKANGAGLKAH